MLSILPKLVPAASVGSRVEVGSMDVCLLSLQQFLAHCTVEVGEGPSLTARSQLLAFELVPPK